MKKVLTKIILIIVSFFVLNVECCYASANYINAEIKMKESTNIDLIISVNDKKNIYGFLGTLVYDQNKLKFEKCTSETHDVSYKNNVLLLEKTNGYKNTNISTCTFSILSKEDLEVNIIDISLSDGEKLLTDENININLNLEEEKSEDENNNVSDNNNVPKDKIENPQTGGKKMIVMVLLIAVTFLCGIIINKKYKIFAYLLFLGLLIYPICISAKISENEIEQIRDILLKNVSDTTNNKYDYDKDNKLSINDLILALFEYKTPAEEEEKDTTAPVIKSCTMVVKDNKTIITIDTDDKDIDKYVVNGDSSLSFTSKEFTVNKILTNVKITAYDTSNNQTNANCIDKTPTSDTNAPIRPTGSENIIYQEDKETMKVWIEKVSRSGRTGYYTTHIWVKDAYNQFKSHVPDNFGKELLTSTELLNNAITKNNLSNKMVVSINASGFVYGSWNTDYYESSPEFYKTSISPIVIVDGVVKRDLSNVSLPDQAHRVYGLTKDSILTYYAYSGGQNQINYPNRNSEITEKIQSDGVKYTFAFKPVVVENYKVKDNVKDTVQNIRQGICQIDKNNFVFVTDIYSNSLNGFSYKEMGEYMVSLGCKTGFNLDGGGSASLTYKPSSGTATSIVSTSRQIADIVYFHE